MRTPSTDGVEVAVHDLGGNGPPLLLAHATGFHGLVWDRFAVLLAQHFRVWSVDFRAHGYSTRGDLRWPAMANDVHAAIAGAGLDRPFVVGHSLGGGLAVLAEHQRPGTFRAMYLYEPAIMPAGVVDGDNVMGDNVIGDNFMSAAARRRRAVFPSRQAAFDNYAGKPPLDELSPGALRAYVEHGFAVRPDGSVELRCAPDDEADTFRWAGDGSAFAALTEVHCPATVARGSIASPGPSALTEVVAERLQARLAVLDGLAHFGPLHDPDSIVPSVVEALLGG